ncbi:MAG: HD family phosphohydrolase [Myxococcota bacterium]
MAPLSERLPGLFGPDAPARRWLVFVVTCVACALLLTNWTGLTTPEWSEGEIADKDVVAPTTFTFLNAAATAERQREAEGHVAPVFEADLTLNKRLENRVSQAFDMARRRHGTESADGAPDPAALGSIRTDFVKAVELAIEPADLDVVAASGFSREIEDIAVELIGVAMRRHVIQDRTALPSPARPLTVVNLLGETRDETTLDDYSLVRTPDEARQAVSLYVLERFAGHPRPADVKAAAAIARAAVRTNFSFNQRLTEERRASVREGVGAVEQKVRKGTRVVQAGDVLTEQQVRMLAALRANSPAAGGGLAFAAWFAFVATLVGSAVFFAQSTVRKFARRPSDREALAFALVLVVAIGRVLGSSAAAIELPTSYDLGALALLVPVAGGAMLVRILVNSESALVWTLVASVLASAMTERSAVLVAYHLVTALVATEGVGQGRERLTVLRAGVLSGVVGAGLVALIALLRTRDAAVDPLLDARLVLAAGATAVLAGLFNAVLALGMVPAFELFGFVTDYKLLELASLNHPLLRQLMLRAPGTYHHSVIVGSLSEAACEAIGANALLARVACYFHDIGKGLKPQYFVENQRDTGNRHDRLSPEHSAQLIINHVREGGVLARQYKLPRPIVDNVYMHHGTGLIAYFHNKAKEQNPGAVVDEAPFRYPGPKPDTREAGIIMLADKVEAACRTIQSPNEERIRAMIQQIINGVMNDGQLENCPLTLKELYQIADTFTNVLLGIYHHRIEYPGTKDISSGKGRLVPVPKQGTITLEIVNPLKHRGGSDGGAPPMAVPDDS